MLSDNSSYFESFADFHPAPHAPLQQEFARLAELRGWQVGSKAYRKQYKRCMFVEFVSHYGSSTEKLEGWQALCREVRMKVVPDTITQCRKVSVYLLTSPARCAFD